MQILHPFSNSPASGRVWVGVVVALLGVALGSRAATPPQRYVAGFTKGNRLFGPEIRDWHADDTRPTLQGKPLFDEGDPVRWVLDRSADTAASRRSEACVEFVGGDRLPGEVMGFVAASPGGADYRVVPQHLLVRPGCRLEHPDAGLGLVRVRPTGLRRIVWQPVAGHTVSPGTVFLRDGRRIAFRTLRWSDDGVRLLTADGPTRLAWGELAELHPPASGDSGWQVLLERWASQGVEPGARLEQWETVDGLRVSAASAWAHRAGRSQDATTWVHTIRPAWSLDDLPVAFERIRAWRFTPATELPLSWLEPIRDTRTPILAVGWPWQRDRSVQQSHLESAAGLHGFGLGVHAPQELSFTVPAEAIGFRSTVALDGVARGGGAARGVVRLQEGDAAGNELGRTDVLAGPTGAEPATIEAELPAAPPRSSRTLTLVADPVVGTERPAGADPFDIRDTLDWIDPVFRLDADRLAASLARRSTEGVIAWAGWEPVLGNGTTVRRSAQWSEDEQSLTPVVEFAGAYLQLCRRMTLAPRSPWLLTSVSGTEEKDRGARPDLVLVAVGEDSIGAWPAGDEVVAPLERWLGDDVELRVAVLPGDETSALEWRTLQPVERVPSLQVLQPNGVEAEPRLFSHPSRPDAAFPVLAEWRAEGKPVRIRDRPALGEYRFARIAWQQLEGEGAALWWQPLGDGRLGLETNWFLHRTTNLPVDVRERYLEAPTGDEMHVEVRDLVDDFAPHDLERVLLTVESGDVRLRELVLTRTRDAAERYRPEGAGGSGVGSEGMPPEPDDRAGWTWLARRVAPGWAVLETGEGPPELRTDFRDRPRALRLHPLSHDRPARLARIVDIPAAGGRLAVSASHHPEGDWRLEVLADGERVIEQVVDAKSASEDGWCEVDVDLASLSGRRVLLEVRAHATGWHYEDAFFARIDIQRAGRL